MKNLRTLCALAVAVGAIAWPTLAQEAKPLYSVQIQSASTKAINYIAMGGSAKITFRGTVLAQATSGEAKVESKGGVTNIDAKFKGLEPASKYGPEYLTYVLWAISPEGRPLNLGEVIPKDGKAALAVTTRFQTFALVVTAEPYYAVSQVGNVVVLENMPSEKDAKYQVDVNYSRLERGQYAINMAPADLKPVAPDKKTPPEFYQAQLAVKLAAAAGADKFAAEPYGKAKDLFEQAQKMLGDKKADKKQIGPMSRQAVQTAEDARQIAMKKQAEEKAAQEKKAMESKVAAAEAAKAAEAQKRAAAETDAAKAREQAAKAEAEKTQLRAQLKDQLSAIAQTTDSARGLIVSMTGILFETGKSTLLPPVREKLARVSGILLAHPGLKLAVEGHTDNVGSEASNLTLSEKRAASVKDYLISQGVAADSISSQGFGMSKPVESNDTPDGRAKNRRVEIVVTGEPIAAAQADGAAK